MQKRAVTAVMQTSPSQLEVPATMRYGRDPAQPNYQREAMTSAIAAITPSAVRVGA